VFDQARKQLTYAKKLVGNNYQQNAILDQRLRDVAVMEEKTKNL